MSRGINNRKHSIAAAEKAAEQVAGPEARTLQAPAAGIRMPGPGGPKRSTPLHRAFRRSPQS